MKSIIFSTIIIMFFLPVFAFAIETPKDFPDFIFFVLEFVYLLVPLIAALALISFFWGVAKFIYSSGNEKAVIEGKWFMFWGVIALFVMMSVWGIVSFFTGSFGFQFGIPSLPTGSKNYNNQPGFQDFN